MFSGRRDWAALRRMGLRMHRLAGQDRRRAEPKPRRAEPKPQSPARDEHRPQPGRWPTDEVPFAEVEQVLRERLLQVKASHASWARISGNLPPETVQRVCRGVPGIYYVGTIDHHNIHIVEKRE